MIDPDASAAASGPSGGTDVPRLGAVNLGPAGSAPRPVRANSGRDARDGRSDRGPDCDRVDRPRCRADPGGLGPSAPALGLPSGSTPSRQTMNRSAPCSSRWDARRNPRPRAVAGAPPNVSAAFFDHVRGSSTSSGERSSSARLMGRRTSGPRDEYASVALWRDDAALAQATGGRRTSPWAGTSSTEWTESYQSRTFDAIALERHASDGPRSSPRGRERG